MCCLSECIVFPIQAQIWPSRNGTNFGFAPARCEAESGFKRAAQPSLWGIGSGFRFGFRTEVLG
jgi:hypothetical protein